MISNSIFVSAMCPYVFLKSNKTVQFPESVNTMVFLLFAKLLLFSLSFVLINVSHKMKTNYPNKCPPRNFHFLAYS